MQQGDHFIPIVSTGPAPAPYGPAQAAEFLTSTEATALAMALETAGVRHLDGTHHVEPAAGVQEIKWVFPTKGDNVQTHHLVKQWNDPAFLAKNPQSVIALCKARWHGALAVQTLPPVAQAIVAQWDSNYRRALEWAAQEGPGIVTRRGKCSGTIYRSTTPENKARIEKALNAA